MPQTPIEKHEALSLPSTSFQRLHEAAQSTSLHALCYVATLAIKLYFHIDIQTTSFAESCIRTSELSVFLILKFQSLEPSI